MGPVAEALAEARECVEPTDDLTVMVDVVDDSERIVKVPKVLTEIAGFESCDGGGHFDTVWTVETQSNCYGRWCVLCIQPCHRECG